MAAGAGRNRVGAVRHSADGVAIHRGCCRGLVDCRLRRRVRRHPDDSFVSAAAIFPGRFVMIRSLTLFAAIAFLAACNRPTSTPYTSASYTDAAYAQRVAGSADARTLPVSPGNVESYAEVVD